MAGQLAGELVVALARFRITVDCHQQAVRAKLFGDLAAVATGAKGCVYGHFAGARVEHGDQFIGKHGNVVGAHQQHLSWPGQGSR